ncbi:hypothetical protein [Paenibacillus sp. PL91]|uniref:hypothetical protein n=1 Tax=Paenibacillus sp. PL91 TaxID=2729538 RepID=UPI00145E503C|nr:hypothetical protein [Paenibacillus sp. PL91]MBC9200897.1 hypothetical protein [Paenibacillus sp. PL91]
MKNNQFSRKVEVLDQFKRSAERNAPEFIDFSERIMNHFKTDHDLTGCKVSSIRIRKRNRTAFTLAAVVMSIVLLSGFTYAAVEGWLSLKDRNSNTVMHIIQTDLQVPEQHDRILNTLRSKLNPGESATVIFGQEAIDAVKRGELPTSSSTIVRGFSYLSTHALAPQLRDVMSNIKLPSDTIQDANLTEAELVPEARIPKSVRWIEATDATTGYPYAYQTGGVTDKITFVMLHYKDGDTTYRISIGSSQQSTLQFSDSSPSSSQIYNVAGTQVYNYKDSKDDFLIWSQQVSGGSLVYSLMSTTVDLKKKISFADAVITAYTEK